MVGDGEAIELALRVRRWWVLHRVWLRWERREGRGVVRGEGRAAICLKREKRGKGKMEGGRRRGEKKEGKGKRIIIHGFKPEFRGFVLVVQRWQTQLSIVEFQNLFVGQEALAKNMGGAPLKRVEQAFCANKSCCNSKQ